MSTMRVMRIATLGTLAGQARPLELAEMPMPEPGVGQVRIKVAACAVCHTEIDEIEGRTPPSSLPRIPGHQVVGTIDMVGPGVTQAQPASRVGVGWIGSACGQCAYCRSGRENLCSKFVATGRDKDGGYAEYMLAEARFVTPLPEAIPVAEAAPLLCAGAIGMRSLSLTGLVNGEPLGLTGFGASGHLMLQIARRRYPESPVYVFARSVREQEFARELGATWAGDTDDAPPEPLTAIVDTTPAWRPVVRALDALAPGGRLIINAIRKVDADRDVLSELDYARHLWREKVIMSVANVTRHDIADCLALAAETGIRATVELYRLADANEALAGLGRGEIRGAKVLILE